MFPIWQGRTCLPTETTNGICTLGAYPTYAVNVSTVAHIQMAVNFARNTNIRLVVKNTGHCYLGKSSGAGSLSIWTHHLKEISFLPEFKSNGYNGGALKVGAGATVREVYTAAEKNNVTAIGGICEVSPSVFVKVVCPLT
jgi:FAD/FMN-containing dehydrogenase